MKNNKQSVNKLSVFIGVLGVIFTILLVVIITSLSHGGKIRKASDVNSLAWELARGNYVTLTRDIRDDRRQERKISNESDYNKFAAIADYALGSFYYHAYEKVDSDRAGQYSSKMEDNVSKMVEYSFAQQEIDEKIESYIEKMQ